MELWMACVLLLLSIGGIVAFARGLQQNKALRIICIVLCAVLALACIVYIGLPLLLVGAAAGSPPAP